MNNSVGTSTDEGSYLKENPAQLRVNDQLFPFVQINGRRVYGPPNDWDIEKLGIPKNNCELFIKGIPKNMSELEIISYFTRFGRIYEFRVMIDYDCQNRGYGYIKFSTEIEALRAKEVMNHFITFPKRNLIVERSYDKCRLFVGNLPRDLFPHEIEEAFRITFPAMKRLVMHNRISQEQNNRGFGFIDFPDHKSALNAKKMCSSGILPMWERDIKIVWAFPERMIDSEVTTLFVRNVALYVNQNEIIDALCTAVSYSQIRKISRVRELAFIDFIDRQSAETALMKLRGTILKGHTLQFEWAMPADGDCIHNIKTIDYDAVFRLKCISNYWTPPIVLYGKNFQNLSMQYICVTIKVQNKPRSFFLQIFTRGLNDIQSRVFEVLLALIKDIGNLPHYNIVLVVDVSDAYVVGHIPEISDPKLVLADKLSKKRFKLHWKEFENLSLVAYYLSRLTTCELLESYYKCLDKPGDYNYIENVFIRESVLGCVHPGYRNKPPLKFELDNTQIILALCDFQTGNNFTIHHRDTVCYNIKDIPVKQINGFKTVIFKIIHLLPLCFSQSKSSTQTNAICFGRAVLDCLDYSLLPLVLNY